MIRAAASAWHSCTPSGRQHGRALTGVTAMHRPLSLGRRSAFDEGNCITDASTRSIVTAASGGGGGSGGGMNGNGSKSGGAGDGAGDGAGSGDRPHPMRLWTFIFAGFLTVGGGVAYLKKGSIKSLGSSLGAAVILALCGRSMIGATAASSVKVAFAITLLLGIAMCSRFAASRKIMPAGLVAGTSLVMSAGYVASGL